MTDEKWNSTIDAFKDHVFHLKTSSLILLVHERGSLDEIANGDYDPGNPETWIPGAVVQNRVLELVEVVLHEIDRRLPGPAPVSRDQ
ncbi:MAG: hypothetical protein ACTHU0_28365 [Kofleriaceae bacterium]